jgi:hypothetical protein
MEEQRTKDDLNHYGLQEYLSLGYIYLVILGIVIDVIYFKFFGINILNYSSISDILMAPINTIVNDVKVLVISILIVGVGFFIVPFLNKSNNLKKAPQKSNEESGSSDEKDVPNNKNNGLIPILLLFPLFVIGLKIGAGSATKSRIENGTFVANHSITFSDNSVKRVKVLGQNSGYVIFVVEGQKELSIVPISGNIKEIKLIHD